MLEYYRDVDPARLGDHPRLAEPPRRDVRRWRDEMSRAIQELFEAIAGGLLGRLGYAREFPVPSVAFAHGPRAELAAYRGRLALWNGGLRAFRRSPVWRVRQAWVRRSSGAE